MTPKPPASHTLSSLPLEPGCRRDGKALRMLGYDQLGRWVPPRPAYCRPAREIRVDRHLLHSAQHELASEDRKSTRLNSSHSQISYAVFCLKKKNTIVENGD